jgi:hypothetical protein
MVVFGGGNEGIVDELHVYNTGESYRCTALLTVRPFPCAPFLTIPANQYGGIR